MQPARQSVTEVRKMKKSTYSLILSDDVVSEIDKIARSMNTNRSLLINHILADYASVTTPEKRNCNIFGDISDIIGGGSDYTVFYNQFDRTLSIKSPLAFRYRPTMRYEVELSRGGNENSYGYIRLYYRTTAPELTAALAEFFRNWMKLEQLYIFRIFPGGKIEYKVEPGRFTRSLAFPNDEVYSTRQTATAICDYILRFDTMMKKWLSGNYHDETALENDYLNYCNSGMPLI